MKKYLEIIRTKDEKLIKRFDVSGHSKESVENILSDKTKKLAKSNFIRIIDSSEDLEAIKVELPKKKK